MTPPTLQTPAIPASDAVSNPHADSVARSEAVLIDGAMPLDLFIARMATTPFELVNGEINPLIPTVFGPGDTINRLFIVLLSFVMQHRLGRVFQEMTFILHPVQGGNWVKGSFVPDLSFYAAGRLEAYKEATPGYEGKPLALIPDLVVEVISPTDSYEDVLTKVAAYRADGVRLIWLVEGGTRTVMVYTSDDQVTLLEDGDTLPGGDVIPGFTFPLAALFTETAV